jgi:lysozyme
MLTAGIDVSNWQGAVDWQAVAGGGAAFAICKATEGLSYQDPWFPRNWHGTAAAGLVRGAYHFAQPDHSEAEDEAEYFVNYLEAAGGLEPGDLVVLDLEAGSGHLGAWVRRWLEECAELVGFKPILYSGHWFMEPHGLTGDAFLAEHGLWLASYGTMPLTPPSWPFWALWQFTSEGYCPGVAGPCDLDVFNGTIEQLRLYGLPA